MYLARGKSVAASTVFDFPKVPFSRKRGAH
jgi:hypothetical protein